MVFDSNNPLQRLASSRGYEPPSRTLHPSDRQAKEEPQEWQDRAACKGRNLDMFPRWHKDISYISIARKICSACPVKPECLDNALTYPITDMHGVWAGLTPRQLAAEQERQGRVPTKPTIAAIWAGFNKRSKDERAKQGIPPRKG